MPEEVFYSEEVHEKVATYIVEHGGKVQVERVNPGWVFHKITFHSKGTRRIGGGDYSPIYLHNLVDGGRLLVQYLRGKGTVPGHYDDYWTAFYIYTEDADGSKKNPERTEHT